MSESAGEILELVRTGRAATRSDLRRITGLSRTAVVARVDALVGAGLLVPGAQNTTTRGRPPGTLLFHAAAGTLLAVAVGRSRTQVAVLDLEGGELARDEVGHQVGAGPDEVMPAVATTLGRLLADVQERGGTGPVLGVGLSLPGSVDPVRGVSLDSPVMAGWDGVELAPYLADVTRAPLWVGNDADVLALSELLGHARRHDDLLVLKASTGLGLGIVADGGVRRGHLGAAGEVGHTRVELDGAPCRCGARGCLETVAAGWALVAARADAGRPVEHVRELTALAVAGEAEARGMLRDSGRRFGEVLAVAINLLNPAAVVVGGDMAAAYDTYVAGLREAVYGRATALATRDLQFLPATYGDRAGVVGCGVLALEHALAPAAVDAWLETL
jgi:predicted NBD/HSP70 family sugar kinase